MNGWKTIQLKTLVEPVKTWNPLSSKDSVKLTYVDLSAVSQERKKIVGAREIFCVDAPSRARQLVRSEDVLVSTVRPNLNAVACVPSSLSGATVSTGFCVLRPNSKMLDSRFLFHWVKSPQFISDMVGKASGASYPAVSDRIVLNSNIPIFKLSEQRRIAGILDEAELLIARRNLSIKLLADLGGVVLDEILNGAKENQGWDETTVGCVAEVQGGLQVTSARKKNPNEVPYLRVANVYRGFLKLDEIKKIRVTEAELTRTLLLKNDILLVEGHGNPEEVGRCALWDASVKSCTHQNHLIRARFDEQRVLSRFACDFLNSSHGRRHLFRAGKTTSGLNTISVSDVRSAPIVIPPFAVQQRYQHRVEMIDAMITRQRDHLAQLNILFASLQHRAFRGEL